MTDALRKEVVDDLSEIDDRITPEEAARIERILDPILQSRTITLEEATRYLWRNDAWGEELEGRLILRAFMLRTRTILRRRKARLERERAQEKPALKLVRQSQGSR